MYELTIVKIQGKKLFFGTPTLLFLNSLVLLWILQLPLATVSHIRFLLISRFLIGAPLYWFLAIETREGQRSAGTLYIQWSDITVKLFCVAFGILFPNG